MKPPCICPPLVVTAVDLELKTITVTGSLSHLTDCPHAICKCCPAGPCNCEDGEDEE